MDNPAINILISGSYNAFADGFNGAGVYLISGLAPSNSFALPIYYGSATDLRKRIAWEHIPQLSCNVHHNSPLQNYYNKHGRENLVIFLVEPCSKAETIERENIYLERERPFCDELRGFNISHHAGRPSGMKGKKHSQETRRKQSDSQRGERNHRFGKEPSNIRKYTLTSPTGEAISFVNVSKFCKENGLNKSHLYKMLNGKYRHHKGWTKYGR